MVEQVCLPDETIREIAMQCGRGWTRSEKPKTALYLEWQMSRIASYRRVIEMAPRYIRSRDGMSKEIRDAIWAHVCAETDLLWKATY